MFSIFKKEVKLSEKDYPPEGQLLAKRFSGPEVFKITKAHWNLYTDGERKNLTLLIECEEGIKLSKQIEYCSESCHWELNLVEDEIEDANLREGFEASIPEGYDESRDGWITNFYFCEHDGTDQNRIRVEDRKEDRILVTITGQKTDLNYYDGSKPETKLYLKAWFTKDTSATRSMN